MFKLLFSGLRVFQTGLCLSEAATKFMKPWLSRTVLSTAILAAVSTALAELLGGAIALQDGIDAVKRGLRKRINACEQQQDYGPFFHNWNLLLLKVIN